MRQSPSDESPSEDAARTALPPRRDAEEPVAGGAGSPIEHVAVLGEN